MTSEDGGGRVAPLTMPAAFIGHGSPMNTLERNRYTNSWRAFGASVPPPRAILVISAHWFINATAVTAMPRPRVIHDFFGFPDDLFEFDYPAPGHPDLAEEVAEIAKPVWVGLDRDSWGLDHGTWSVLAHAFPEADIPVVQLSVNAMKPLEYHVDLGARLGPLRAKGVLIVGSGNIVHNLAAIDPSMPAAGTEWARRFDDAARAILTTEPGDASGLDEHPDFGAAVPTTDHFVPMLYLAGLAGAAGRPADVMVDGYTFGSLSMTAYTLDAGPAPDPVAAGAGGAIPDPADVPPEDTNI